jgi:peptidoglycan pentaglycine glycine transferase (the second and third glycine)
MFMTYGSEVIYLFSGSDEKYMRDYNAQYLIQYHMLKFAAANHFKIYNFYGINGLPDENSKDYGIYEFKKGFGGHVVELIGSFELSLSKTYTLAKKIRH